MLEMLGGGGGLAPKAPSLFAPMRRM